MDGRERSHGMSEERYSSDDLEIYAWELYQVNNEHEHIPVEEWDELPKDTQDIYLNMVDTLMQMGIYEDDDEDED